MVELKLEELVALWALVGGLFGLFVAFAVAWVRSECRRIREVGAKECEIIRLDCEIRCLNIRYGK